MTARSKITAHGRSRSIERPTRWFLGAFFLVSGFAKVSDPQLFIVSIYQYQMPTPEALNRLAALWIPWVEILCGAGLVWGLFREGVFTLVFLQMFFFLIVTGQAVFRGLDFDCGCLGSLFHNPDTGEVPFLHSVRFALIRNLVLLAMASYLFSTLWRTESSPPEPARSSAS